MVDQLRRSRVQENLLNLYLRLNGYFVTGFIAHSHKWGENRAQIDALALRHPYNCEPSRMIEPSNYLKVSSELIDLLICEVKSRGERLQFNKAFREEPEALVDVLRWAGLFTEDEVFGLAEELRQLLIPSNIASQEIPCLIGPRGTRIRAALCSPEIWEKDKNQPWFIFGSEIFGYLYDCFCPIEPRETCSTQYDFSLWGEVYEPIVRFFKENRKARRIDDLYQHLDIS